MNVVVCESCGCELLDSAAVRIQGKYFHNEVCYEAYEKRHGEDINT